MTPTEFKAWFEGFTEAFTGCPSKAQWERIKARVSEIDGKPITERVFVDRYWPTYSAPLKVYPLQTYCRIHGVPTAVNTLTYSNAGAASFDSSQAMTVLGRSEAMGVN